MSSMIRQTGLSCLRLATESRNIWYSLHREKSLESGREEKLEEEKKERRGGGEGERRKKRRGRGRRGKEMRGKEVNRHSLTWRLKHTFL